MNNSSLLILGGIYTINLLDILLYEKKDHINSQSIKFNIKSEQSQFINKESGVSLNFQFNMQF
jgi:hypothetical protein